MSASESLSAIEDIIRKAIADNRRLLQAAGQRLAEMRRKIEALAARRRSNGRLAKSYARNVKAGRYFTLDG